MDYKRDASFRIGLNRTSVGLKRGTGRNGRARDYGPQSNQRGIETSVKSQDNNM